MLVLKIRTLGLLTFSNTDVKIKFCLIKLGVGQERNRKLKSLTKIIYLFIVSFLIFHVSYNNLSE